jgi:hypothetical protein
MQAVDVVEVSVHPPMGAEPRFHEGEEIPHAFCLDPQVVDATGWTSGGADIVVAGLTGILARRDLVTYD